MCVCVCVFINFHRTAQFGSVVLVVLCRIDPPKGGSIIFIVCVCIFINLRTTAQSGRRPSHSIPFALILPRGINDTLCVHIYLLNYT